MYPVKMEMSFINEKESNFRAKWGETGGIF
jgi:hypothetical protein